MHKCFNLKIENDEFLNEIPDKLATMEYYIKKKRIREHINGFVKEDKHIDATRMQSNWFPIVPANIFLSHSHDDLPLARKLAYYIEQNLKLKVFVDSCIWGNSERLQEIIDKEYCETSKGHYDYKLRNRSTSHVHMMLNMALANMIDNTECVIFLNTPNSVKPNETVDQTTSPWIFSELSMTRIIRDKAPDEYRELHEQQQRMFANGGQFPRFDYNIPTDHLADINEDDIISWRKAFLRQNYLIRRRHPLDILYDMTDNDIRML